MSIEFKLPNLGEGVKSADIAGITVKPGDVLEPNQNILELETDKAVVELPCPIGGKVLNLHVKQGQTVTPGTLILTLEGNGASSSGSTAPTAPAAEKKPAPAPATASAPPANSSNAAPPNNRGNAGGEVTFSCPNLGEGIKSADVAGVMVKAGDVITANQNILELETDKAVVELPCPTAGKVLEVLVQTGSTVQPGTPLLKIAADAGQEAAPAAVSAPTKPADAAAKPAAAPVKPAAASAPANNAPSSPVSTATPSAANDRKAPAPAGPATRRLARQLGVDLYQVAGSGPGGRITMEDVQAFVRQIMQGEPAISGAAPSKAVTAPPLPDFTQFGPIERKAMNRIAKTSAANLSYAWQTIPHVTQHDLADVTDLEAGRKRHTQNQKSGAKITMTVLAIKAVVAALKQYPHFNASMDSATEEIVLKQYYHIGVAVDTEFGLVVPVIRDCNHKSILEIAAELDGLAAKARERKLSPSDFQGGTFTITNLGGIGGTMFSPIVNWPEVAILGMSRAKQQYVVMDGEPKVRLMLPLSMSYDHRVINGADAARFITKVSGLLADPSQLLIES